MTQPLTHTPQVKRLERSSSSRVVAGVSGGLGRYFDLNPAVFRLGFVVLTLLGGAGLLVYLTAVLVIPDEGKDASIAAEVLAERRDRPWPLVGLGLIGVATLVLISRGELWPSAGAGWFLLLVGGLVILWTSSRGSRGRRIAIAATVTLTLLLAAAITAAVAFAWFKVACRMASATASTNRPPPPRSSRRAGRHRQPRLISGPTSRLRAHQGTGRLAAG
jgi:phage shock protein PspC (stress-responsive transcriptional regulator)